MIVPTDVEPDVKEVARQIVAEIARLRHQKSDPAIAEGVIIIAWGVPVNAAVLVTEAARDRPMPFYDFYSYGKRKLFKTGIPSEKRGSPSSLVCGGSRPIGPVFLWKA